MQDRLVQYVDVMDTAKPQLLPSSLPSHLAPLGFAQERSWLQFQLQPDSVTYNTHAALRLFGPLDSSALEQSLNSVVARHDSLRTTIAFVDEQPGQRVAPALRLALPLVDLSETARALQEDVLAQMTAAAIAQPFDLVQGPNLRATLFRLSPQQHVLQVVVHPVAAGMWSLAVLIREVAAVYSAILTGEPAALPASPLQYTDFATAQRAHAQNGQADEHIAFWRTQLADTPVLALPTDRPRPAVQTMNHTHRAVEPSDALWEGLRQLGAPWGAQTAGQPAAASQASGQAAAAGDAEEAVSLFEVLAAAFEVLLYRYSGQVDFALGVLEPNRDIAPDQHLIGPLANPVTWRADLSGAPSFRELLARVRAVAQQTATHRAVPFEQLVATLQPHRDLSYAPIFQVMCSNGWMALQGVAFAGLTWNVYDIDGPRLLVDLNLKVFDLPDRRQLRLEYDASLFDATTIDRMLAQYQVLLANIVAHPDESIAHLAILPDAERELQLTVWNDTTTPYPEHACLHQLFEQQVMRTPDAVAVVFEEQSVTYAALNLRASQLASYLRGLGVGPETFVGVCLERSVDLVVSLLAILKAGGAYLPLDPAFPVDRLAYMLSDAQAPVVLAQTGLLPELMASLPVPGPQIVYVDTLQTANTPPAYAPADTHAAGVLANSAPSVNGNHREPGPDNLVYVIYTSGSTGKPKGVQLLHRTVVNFLTTMAATPGMTAQDTVLAVTTLSFDIAVLEIFLPLVTGATTVIVSQEVARDGRQLADQLARSGATVMQATPATWRTLIEAGWQGDGRLKALCGGEAFPSDLAQQLLDRVGSLWNMYGPTETTVWSTVYEVKTASESIPIGRPIANTELYILDEQRQPVPIGVAGELYIGGAGVARGYLHLPELTDEKFVPNPFCDAPGARLYRTGDLARYLADGNVQFLGRLDHQVKVRGFRIELGEVEVVLRQHPAAAEAVVVARTDSSGSKYLAAYMTGAQAAAISPAEWRHFLSAKLPAYMVPSTFTVLERFPLTPNGKIDRKRLPDPGEQSTVAPASYSAPQTALELQLTKLWERILQRQQVGINENFFEIGGHSLLAARMFVQLEALTGRRLPLATLFEAPTIEQLAALLEDDNWSPPWSVLVPIQPEGSQPPFFCVHGFGGDVVGYHDLADLLGKDQPFYGLQAYGLNGDDAPHTSIEQMAAYYVDAIRSIQPHGPYYLGGYCHGGLIAYEMARLLQQAGERTNLVAIFEGYALSKAEAQTQFWRPKAVGSFVRNFPFWLNDHFRPGGPYNRWFGHVSNELRRIVPQLVRTHDLDHARSAVTEAMCSVDATSTQRRALRQAHAQATNQYQPQPYAGRVTLFRVHTMSLFRTYDPGMGWGKLALGGLDVRLVAGAHYNILEMPHVVSLAAELKDSLEKARQAA